MLGIKGVPCAAAGVEVLIATSMVEGVLVATLMVEGVLVATLMVEGVLIATFMVVYWGI